MDHQLKNVVLSAQSFFEALEEIDQTLTDKNKDHLKALVSRPIGLRDSGSFNLIIHSGNREDIKNARRELSGAIAAQRWTDGFLTAVKIMLLLGG